jgi:hypothetical protein
MGDTEKNVSRIFVLSLKEKPEKIVGYYSLSALLVPINGIPEGIRKKLPRYEALGTTLMGKLAIAEDFQRDKCELRLGKTNQLRQAVIASVLNQCSSAFQF